MSRPRRFVPRLLFLIPAFLVILSFPASAQPIPPSLLSDHRGRPLGPVPAGGATGLEGIPDQPDPV